MLPPQIDVQTRAKDAKGEMARAVKRMHRWEMIEPQPLSVWLPWNWLAIALDTAPDPDALFFSWDSWKNLNPLPLPQRVARP
jgi:hypothetical protein